MGLGRSSDGLVAVFDVTNKASLEVIEPFAAELIRARPDAARVLVGTKCDGDRTVARAEGEGVAARLGMQYFEASASTGAGVREAFEAAIRSAWECSQRKLRLCMSEPLQTMAHRTSGFSGRATETVTACPCACCLV